MQLQLTPHDFQNLLSLVRRSSPSDFAEGKTMVALEVKLINILQDAQAAELDTRVQEEISKREQEQGNDGDLPDATE